MCVSVCACVRVCVFFYVNKAGIGAWACDNFLISLHTIFYTSAHMQNIYNHVFEHVTKDGSKCRLRFLRRTNTHTLDMTCYLLLVYCEEKRKVRRGWRRGG